MCDDMQMAQDALSDDYAEIERQTLMAKQAGEDSQAEPVQATPEAEPTPEAEKEPEAEPAPEAEKEPEAEPKPEAEKKRGRPRKQNPPPTDWEILENLAQAFADAGLVRPDDYGKDKADDEWHRCLAEGQTCSQSNGNGSYVLHWDSAVRHTLVCHNFSGGGYTAYRTWRLDGKRMSRAERKELERMVRERRDELIRKTKLQADAVARQARASWDLLPPLKDVCGYLESKSLAGTYGLRGTAARMFVPLRNAAGEIRALQTISRNSNGGYTKLFPKGSQMPGLYFEFPDGNGSGPICIGEGLATVATVVDVTGWQGVAAMNCGNLDAVTGAIRRRWPDRPIVILADNDIVWNNDAVNGPKPHRKGEVRPEEDNSGVVKARAAAQKHGVKVAVCPALAGQCTDFNDLYVRSGGGAAGAAAVKEALASAQYVAGCPVPTGYDLRLDGEDDGLYCIKEKDGDVVRLGPPLIVDGHIHDDNGTGWGLIVSWTAPDGAGHRLRLTRADMVSRERLWLTHLVDGGYQADSRYAADLLRFLELSQPGRQLLYASQTGWLDSSDHGCFVLPRTVIGAPAGMDPADVAFTGGCRTAQFKVAGTLQEWTEHVATMAIGNSKCTFALCVAFTGPLLHILGIENGGFHLFGSSSVGKSTLLRCALSVWDCNDALSSWRATDNGKEVEAFSRNDTLLCLDEINQSTAKNVGAIAYMLGNGIGKSRSNRNGELREPKRFRLIFLSSGETTLEQVLTSHGEQYMAGMDVRCVNIPVDKSDVKNLHGCSSTGVFMNILRDNSSKYYGTAGIDFVNKLIDLIKNKNSSNEKKEIYNLLLTKNLNTSTDIIIESANLNKNEIDPQVRRVAERIAIVASAGSIARRFKILPEEIDVMNSCVDAFKSWIKLRGGTSSHEEKIIVDKTKNFLLSNSDNLFYSIEDGKRIGPTYGEVIGFKINDEEKLNYYIFPGSIEKRAWDGMNIDTVLSVLKAYGFFSELSEKEKGRRYYQKKKTIPFRGVRVWVYCISIPEDIDTNN